MVGISSSGGYWSGSAEFVDIPELPDQNTYDYIVSATHVFMDGPNLVANALLHINTPTNQILTINAQSAMVVYSIAADICVLRIPKVVGRYKLKMSDMSNVNVGNSLYCLGFTAGDDYQNMTICNIKDLSYSNWTCPPNSISVDSVTMMGGNSGGPWVNHLGELVAICSWGYVTSLPNHSHDSNGNVVGDVSINSFPDSFDIFGVGVLSLKKLVEKYNAQSSQPYKYPGMTIDSLRSDTILKAHELAYNTLSSYSWHTKMVGAHLLTGNFTFGDQHVSSIPQGAIITEFDGKEIGMMNDQYKNWDLDIFYSNSPSISVTYVINGSTGTANLPIRARTVAEDAEFEKLINKKINPSL